jgi:O-antigen/teichoic acid export membrane protein
MFVREIYGYQLNAWHKEKVYLKIVALSAATNFTLNIIFTPRYGMVCAAWITVASEIVNLVFMRLAAEKVLKTKVFAHIPKVILPASAMVLSIVLLKHFNINVVINEIRLLLNYNPPYIIVWTCHIINTKPTWNIGGACVGQTTR